MVWISTEGPLVDFPMEELLLIILVRNLLKYLNLIDSQFYILLLWHFIYLFQEIYWEFLLLHPSQIPPHLEPESLEELILLPQLLASSMKQANIMYIVTIIYHDSDTIIDKNIFTVNHVHIQGQRYALSQQVINFETTLGQLRKMMSGGDLSRYLAKSIALVVIGSNDYINNYLLPSMYPSSYNYRPPEFANLLLNHYARQLVVH